MNLDEMKLAVLLRLGSKSWHRNDLKGNPIIESIDWPTNGLQICHEAEKLLDWNQRNFYQNHLLAANVKKDNGLWLASMPYEIRLECLCRIWWPERFKNN